MQRITKIALGMQQCRWTGWNQMLTGIFNRAGKQCGFVLKMVIYRQLGHARSLRNLVHAGTMIAMLQKQVFGRIQNPPALFEIFRTSYGNLHIFFQKNKNGHCFMGVILISVPHGILIKK